MATYGIPSPLPIVNRKAKLRKWAPVIIYDRLHFGGILVDGYSVRDRADLFVSNHVVRRAKNKHGEKMPKVFIDSEGNEVTLVSDPDGFHFHLLGGDPDLLKFYTKPPLHDHWQADLNRLNAEARARRNAPPPPPPPPPVMRVVEVDDDDETIVDEDEENEEDEEGEGDDEMVDEEEDEEEDEMEDDDDEEEEGDQEEEEDDEMVDDDEEEEEIDPFPAHPQLALLPPPADDLDEPLLNEDLPRDDQPEEREEVDAPGREEDEVHDEEENEEVEVQRREEEQNEIAPFDDVIVGMPNEAAEEGGGIQREEEPALPRMEEEEEEAARVQEREGQRRRDAALERIRAAAIRRRQEAEENDRRQAEERRRENADRRRVEEERRDRDRGRRDREDRRDEHDRRRDEVIQQRRDEDRGRIGDERGGRRDEYIVSRAQWNRARELHPHLRSLLLGQVPLQVTSDQIHHFFRPYHVVGIKRGVDRHRRMTDNVLVFFSHSTGARNGYAYRGWRLAGRRVLMWKHTELPQPALRQRFIDL